MANIFLTYAILAFFSRPLTEATPASLYIRTSEDVITPETHINCTGRFYDGTNALQARDAYLAYVHKPDTTSEGIRRRPYPRRYNIEENIYPTNPGPYDLFPITQTGAFPEAVFDKKDFIVLDSGSKVADVVTWKGRSDYERCLIP